MSVLLWLHLGYWALETFAGLCWSVCLTITCWKIWDLGMYPFHPFASYFSCQGNLASQDWQQRQCNPEVLWLGGFEEQEHRGCLDTFRSPVRNPVSLETKKFGKIYTAFFSPYETKIINCLIHLFSVQALVVFWSQRKEKRCLMTKWREFTNLLKL